MVKIKYGINQREGLQDDPWTKLETIQEYLIDQEPVPGDLARWLGTAIENSNRDGKKLLKNLGVMRKQGKAAPTFIETLPICKRIEKYHRFTEDSPSVSISKACDIVLTELSEEGDEYANRDVKTLERWYKTYRDAKNLET